MQDIRSSWGSTCACLSAGLAAVSVKSQMTHLWPSQCSTDTFTPWGRGSGILKSVLNRRSTIRWRRECELLGKLDSFESWLNWSYLLRVKLWSSVLLFPPALLVTWDEISTIVFSSVCMPGCVFVMFKFYNDAADAKSKCHAVVE